MLLCTRENIIFPLILAVLYKKLKFLNNKLLFWTIPIIPPNLRALFKLKILLVILI
jgi:hypothetical protein